MIVYKLVCPLCEGEIEDNIDENTFISNLIKESSYICQHCGGDFIPEDSDYHGREE